jgi:hypothetical protein
LWGRCRIHARRKRRDTLLEQDRRGGGIRIRPRSVSIGTGRITGRVGASLEDVSIGDRVELRVRDPETVDIDPEFDLSYEEEWPIHVFELM